MALGRFLVSYKNVSVPDEDEFTNTLYFNITPDGPIDWQDLVDDLAAIYRAKYWLNTRQLTVRAYDMGDAEPRPPKATKVLAATGTAQSFVPQVALCLSYYADRNLPRQRGRIYVGPFGGGAITLGRPSPTQMSDVLALATEFSNLGGINVDWSLYSPTTGSNTRISNAWVDNSWDIIRSRKLPGTSRITWSGDG